MTQSTDPDRSIAAKLASLADTLEIAGHDFAELSSDQQERLLRMIAREMPDALRRVAASVAVIEHARDCNIVDLRPVFQRPGPPTLTVIDGGAS